MFILKCWCIWCYGYNVLSHVYIISRACPRHCLFPQRFKLLKIDVFSSWQQSLAVCVCILSKNLPAYWNFRCPFFSSKNVAKDFVICDSIIFKKVTFKKLFRSRSMQRNFGDAGYLQSSQGIIDLDMQYIGSW